ncbi:fumarylacetoacetate hydrolase family protein [Plantibacter sp. Mn2098]|uniref:fumarylacetoacetate hydrolase family protein n=1 Tax=Plantibacter sp. Mn2098 TaxID=3395266 RepID=UPI003BD714E3
MLDLPIGLRAIWRVLCRAVPSSAQASRRAWECIGDHCWRTRVRRGYHRLKRVRSPAGGSAVRDSLPLALHVVTVDELPDRDAIDLRAMLNGEIVQAGNTHDLIVPVVLVALLTQVVTLFPGDVPLTGTPVGVGMGRQSEMYIRAGDELVSSIDGVGEIRQRFSEAGM